MIPAHFICWNHFYSFLSVQTRVQETRRSGPPESRRTLSRRNHFSSFLPGETGAKGARRSGSPGCTAFFFRGNQFSSFLPARTAALEAKRSGSPGCTALFFKGTTFPHSFRLGPQPWKPGDRARRDAPDFFSREPLSLMQAASRSEAVGSPIIFPEGTAFPRSFCFTDAFGRHLDFRQKFFL